MTEDRPALDHAGRPRCPACSATVVLALVRRTQSLQVVALADDGRWVRRTQEPETETVDLPPQLACARCGRALGPPEPDLLAEICRHVLGEGQETQLPQTG